MVQKEIDLWFDENFLKNHAGKIMSDPDFALIELVANCWDAGAEKVEIMLPETYGEIISIKDDGTGMTLLEFEKRWKALGYNRVKHQGKMVVFADQRSSNRLAYGRSGKGRFSMFCFSDKYMVETCKNGIKSNFIVSLRGGAFIVNLKSSEEIDKNLHGTTISAILSKKLALNKNHIIGLIGSKFVADPSFKIYVNKILVTHTQLEHLIDEFWAITPYGRVDIALYDTQRAGRTTQQSGIAWWVNKRLVGTPTWKVTRGTLLDGRTSEAKQYTFVVKADILDDDIKADWSGFKDTKKYREVDRQVSTVISKKLQELFSSKRELRKKKVLKTHSVKIRKLSSLSKDKVGKFIDLVQENCPRLAEEDLDHLTSILINLEGSNTGYELLDKLAKVSSADLDELTSILSQWTIQDAKIVLEELERRLKLIENLEKIVRKRGDELRELQPIFEKGLWIFGPEYDSVQFTSNRTMTTVIRTFFNKKFSKILPERPDFVVLPDSTLGIYAAEKYNDDGEVDGFRKILMIELKKGGTKLTDKELDQAKKYAYILLDEGHISESTEIVAYVLGSSTDKSARPMKLGRKDNINIMPLTFSIILRKAHARTFNLIEKIRKSKNLLIQDQQIKEISKQRNLV